MVHACVGLLKTNKQAAFPEYCYKSGLQPAKVEYLVNRRYGSVFSSCCLLFCFEQKAKTG